MSQVKLTSSQAFVDELVQGEIKTVIGAVADHITPVINILTRGPDVVGEDDRVYTPNTKRLADFLILEQKANCSFTSPKGLIKIDFWFYPLSPANDRGTSYAFDYEIVYSSPLIEEYCESDSLKGTLESQISKHVRQRIGSEESVDIKRLS